MDLDAYLASKHARWARLDELASTRRLTGPETDELVDLYQEVSTHLSVIRGSAPDPSLVGHLSALLLRARGKLAGRRPMTWGAVGGFFTQRFPAALYRLRWWWISTTLVNVAVAAIMMWWLVEHPSFETKLLPPDEIDQLVTEDFEGYYSEFAPSHFAASVWVNNAWVAAQCLAFGILGVPVVWVLLTNLVNLAVVGALMINHDRAGLFFGLILPHGLLELTAVFIAAGIGLRLFWAWIVPGARTRIQAVAHEGRTTGTVALGLVVVLAISGIIEGFVTPSSLPTWARIAIGVLAELALFAYVYGPGRAAYLRGETGDIDEERRGAFLPAVE